MKILKAIQFASTKHKGQVRRVSELPYITHPIVVMELVQKYKGSSKHIEELKCSALLHDTLEDTDTSYFELEREFGSMVASLVLELSSDKEKIKEIGKHPYIKEKMLGMSQYALTLKLLDRFSNILDEPGKNYTKKTVELMEYLMNNRKDITKRQQMIIGHIVDYINGLSLDVIDAEAKEFKNGRN